MVFNKIIYLILFKNKEKMNRNLTHTIRYLMDEWIPSVIRDNKFFMYPIFGIWFKWTNLDTAMRFKSLAPNMNDEDFERVYSSMKTFAKDRTTDLNSGSINHMLKNIHTDVKSIMDIGCGNGYWLGKLDEKKYALNGCDIFNRLTYSTAKFHKGKIEALPFADKSFDMVTCHHTLEHIPDIKTAINELKRIARKQIMIVVPRQRYYYYTLDYHLNFFHYPESLISIIDIPNHTLKNVYGDWVFIGNL